MGNTTRQEIEDWFIGGQEVGAAFMVVACDKFSHEDYPIYASDIAEARKIVEGKAMRDLSGIHEVYDLNADRTPQLASKHAWAIWWAASCGRCRSTSTGHSTWSARAIFQNGGQKTTTHPLALAFSSGRPRAKGRRSRPSSRRSRTCAPTPPRIARPSAAIGSARINGSSCCHRPGEFAIHSQPSDRTSSPSDPTTRHPLVCCWCTGGLRPWWSSTRAFVCPHQI
jgi:hypothetical protein